VKIQQEKEQKAVRAKAYVEEHPEFKSAVKVKLYNEKKNQVAKLEKEMGQLKKDII